MEDSIFSELSDLLGVAAAPLIDLRYRRDGEDRRLVLPEGGLSRSTEGDWNLENDEVRLTLEAEAGEASLLIRFRVEALEEIELIQVRPLVLPWPWPGSLEGWRVFQNGFQSWTPTGSVPAGSRPALPFLRAFSTMNHHVDSPYFRRRDGLLSHDVMVLGNESAGEAWLVGFISSRAGVGEIFLKNRGEHTIEVSLDYGGKRLEKGRCLEGEPLLLVRGSDGQSLLEDWADELGSEMGARAGTRSPVGWCSWYEYYDKVSEADVLANLQVIEAHDELGIDLLQIDDGYQAAIGDWLEQSSRFPNGLKKPAGEIRAAGKTAGIWLAPFFAEPRSGLFRKHPEWFLRNEKGRLIDAGFNPVWRTRLRSLDLTHPGVEAWLRRVFEGLIEAGFDYFKIDFIYAGLRHGKRHDPGKSPLEAYRNGLSIIRRTIGEERFLLGCGAPLSASIGFVDAMRIGADVKESWDSRLAAFVGRGAGYPSAKLAIAGTLARSFLHRRAWLNDPDCLLVRDRNTKLGLAEVETLVTVLGMSGGMLFLSDDMTSLTPERLEMAKAALPPTELAARPEGLMSSNPPDRVVLESEAGSLVALINWEDEPRSVPAPAADKGSTLFDFWRQAPLEQGEELSIPPHGVRAVSITPEGKEPQLVGSSFHLTALLDGRIQASWDEKERALSISGRDMARRDGRIWLRAGGGYDLKQSKLPALVEEVETWSRGWALRLSTPATWSLKIPFSKATGRRGKVAAER
ncbi:MAG: glycoside hydrolase family 36 protein [Myxococcota bacterium]